MVNWAKWILHHIYPDQEPLLPWRSIFSHISPSLPTLWPDSHSHMVSCSRRRGLFEGAVGGVCWMLPRGIAPVHNAQTWVAGESFCHALGISWAHICSHCTFFSLSPLPARFLFCHLLHWVEKPAKNKSQISETRLTQHSWSAPSYLLI